jgi:hypothetical protein
MYKKRLIAAVLFVLGTSQAPAQTLCANNTSKLGCLIPTLYGPTGLTLPNPTHNAHFDSDFQSNFSPVNNALASQLTLLPLASPASGFTYAFDTAAGVYTRSAQSFGPILTERAETIGAGKLFLGFTYQRFNFSSIDGTDLHNLPSVFTHADEPPGVPSPFKRDIITTNNTVDMKVGQFTAFGTVGITDRIDVSVAVPMLDVKLAVTSDATIQRTTPPDPVAGQPHYFDPNDINGSTQARFTRSGTAAGIGDVTVRLKGTVLKGERSALALAADFRLPSGDELDFLGSGAIGFKPFVAASMRAGRVAPHFNAGFQWNGKSVLGGSIITGQKGKIPNQFIYGIGADVGANRRTTFAFDLLGQRVFNGSQVFTTTFSAPAPISRTFPQTGVRRSSFNITNFAVGVKYNLVDRLLITANLLTRLDDGGLRDRVIPLVGISYTF